MDKPPQQHIAIAPAVIPAPQLIVPAAQQPIAVAAHQLIAPAPAQLSSKLPPSTEKPAIKRARDDSNQKYTSARTSILTM
jgi:hypothetical protein